MECRLILKQKLKIYVIKSKIQLFTGTLKLSVVSLLLLLSTLALANPNLTDPNLTDPNLTDPNLTDPNLTDPNLTDPNLKGCYLNGLSERVQCGSVKVPEDYGEPEGKQITIHYAIIPAIKEALGQAPLLAVSGGPGQSAIDQAKLFAQTFYRIRQDRDLILVDQRGTGKSNILECSEVMLSDSLSFNDEKIDQTEVARACLEEQDADVVHYGSLTALKDFERVRQQLSIDRWHLYGISYGTRMVQLYMRHYPEQVATATLDGVVPMQQSVITVGHAINRAFDQVLEDCKTTDLCQKRFPELETQFDKIVKDLAVAPVKTSVLHPLTSKQSEFLVTQNKFLSSLRLAMYNPSSRSLVPYIINAAAKGNYRPLLGLLNGSSDIGIAMGMHMAVVCGEDFHRLTPGQEQQLVQSSVVAAKMVELFKQTCPVWQIPTVSEDFSEPVNSDIPTLLLSGEMDPATPPSWGEMAAEQMTNSLHLVAPYATHGVAFQSCASELIAQLIDTESIADLDSSCLEKDTRRAFYLSANTVESRKESRE